ncbi:MAG: hypothetical protein MUF18_08320 [Fimbriiglobus sp.]|nr:hypothetical protein [Fimbriiglobus sp.]
MFCDPWIEADEEGYFWVRRGALVGRAGPDEWGVVTERRELARLTPFPDMCLPFGDNVNLAQPRPTKRESEEWGRGMAVAINEGDLGKRRKHLLRYSTSDNELLASWAVHSLTRLPADPSTAAAVRELLDDAAISPLVVITADRLLCAYQPDSWPSSADRVNVLVKTLQRTRLTERQMLELVYFVKTELSDPVLMEVYRNAYKLSEKEFWKRPTLVKCIDVLGKLPPRGVRSKVQPEPEEELVAAGKFFKALCSQEYPPLVRLRAEKRLTDPEFQR